MMQPSEHQEQCALMQWWGLSCARFGISEQLLFAIPNGGLRNAIVAAKMKAEGVRAGVPDLFLAVPSMGFHGLFVEMKKAHGGTVSTAQYAMIDLLDVQKYKTAVCHGWRSAAETIGAYLSARKGEELSNNI